MEGEFSGVDLSVDGFVEEFVGKLCCDELDAG